MATEKVWWKGQSGRTYEYFVHPIRTNWKPAAGNYIFAKRILGRWQAVYVGETENLQDRLPGHERLGCAVANGATHVHAHLTPGGSTVRKAEELDLILAHSPVCNRQNKAA